MAGALVVSLALKAFQSAKMMVMEEVKAFISIKYCSFSLMAHHAASLGLFQ